MTKYLLPSNYAIDNPHAVRAVFLPLYHPRHVLSGLGSPALTHWSRWTRKLVKRCKNHLYVGSQEVPGLRLARSTLRRRMKGILSDPRRSRRHNSRRETNCSQGLRRRKGLKSLLVWFVARRVRRNLRNWRVKLTYRTRCCFSTSSEISSRTASQTWVANGSDEAGWTRSNCSLPN